MRTHAGWVTVVGLWIGLAGCEGEPAREQAAAAKASPAPKVREAVAAPPPAPAAPEPPPRLFARKHVSRLREKPSVDSKQFGFMRAGAVLTAKTAKPVGHDRCRRGWYEVSETGGFVCDGREVTAFRDKALPDVQPVQADRSRALPYDYAYTTRSGTPMYKRLPTEEEALIWEDGIIPDAGADPAESADVSPKGSEGDAGAPKPKPKPTLAELQGERGAFVRRVLQAGFYVSLDRELTRGRRKYWRSQSSGYVPAGRLKQVEGTAFEGVDIAVGPHPRAVPEVVPRVDAGIEGNLNGDPRAGTTDVADAAAATGTSAASAANAVPPAAGPHAGPLHLPIGYVLASKTHRFRQNEKGWIKRADAPGYHHVFEIVGTLEKRGRIYLQDPEGYLYRSDQVRRVDSATPPRKWREGERWLDIDLDNQSLVAYEGRNAVRATLISSGRVRGGPRSPHNHATPVGTYRVLSKHITATMDGDHAVDGPYSLEDVPYVQFFQGALALHSAFWHNRFGRASSHGCINLPPRDALWLFSWTGPDLPQAWHGVYPADRNSGTLLRIRGETPPG